jgi:mannose-6-phosphate isomerase-like protein (cupin superfamily)
MPIRTKSEMKANKGGEIIPLPAGNSAQACTFDVGLGYSEVPVGGTVRAHTHDRLEVYIVISGRAKMMAGDDIRQVSAGDVLIAPIGAAHAIQTIGNEPLVYYALNSPPAATAPMVDVPAEVQKKFDEA